MRSVSMGRLVVVVVAAALAGCPPMAPGDGGADGTGHDGGPVDVPRADVAADVAVDAGEDVAADVAMDVPGDDAIDAGEDVPADVGMDVGMDAGMDAAADVPLDAAGDRVEASVDAGGDGGDAGGGGTDAGADGMGSAMCTMPDPAAACAAARVLPGPGTYTNPRTYVHEFDTSCGRNDPSTSNNLLSFTLTSPHDVTVHNPSVFDGCTALLSSCSPRDEIRCDASGSSALFTARNLPAGTYYLVCGISASPITLDFAPPTVPPANDVCPPGSATGPAEDLADGAVHTAHLAALGADYSPTNDAVYRLTLAATSDVEIDATDTSHAGAARVALRSSPCESGWNTRGVWSPALGSGTSNVAVVQRSLPAGTYWVIVSNQNNADVTVQATIAAPSAISPDEVCPPTSSSPAIDLAGGAPQTAHYGALNDDYTFGTFGSVTAPDAVYRLTLTAPSDVHVTSTPLVTSFGSTTMALRSAGCATLGDQIQLVGPPLTIGPNALTHRALPAGTYWLVTENEVVTDVTFQATIRAPGTSPPEDTFPPTPTSPAVDLTNNASLATSLAALWNDYASYNDGVYRLTLTAPSDVHVTVTGAGGIMLLDAPCLAGRVFAVSTPGRLRASQHLVQPALTAGTYWLLVSGTGNVVIQPSVSPPAPAVHYVETDSPAGVSFVDACAASGHGTLSATASTAAALPSSASPFPLRMYNVNASTNMSASGAGWLSLLTTYGSDPLAGLGSPDDPNLVVAPMWLDFNNPGPICYASVGTAPNRRFVVEWSAMRESSSSAPITFEAIFNEAPANTNNTIDIVYATPSTSSGTATRGVEDDTGTVTTAIGGSFALARTVRLTPM